MIKKKHAARRFGSGALCIALIAGGVSSAQPAQQPRDAEQPAVRAEARKELSHVMHVASRMREQNIALSQVVQTAERQADGQAVSVRPRHGRVPLCFEVLVQPKTGGLVSMTIDARDMKVVERVVVRRRSDTARPDAALDEQAWMIGPDRYVGTRLMAYASLEDTPVRNRAGQDLGNLVDLAIDPSNGRVIYAVVSFGGFMNMGEDLFAVPLQAFEQIAEDHVVMSVTEQEMENAEGFEEDDWPRHANWRWALDPELAKDPSIELRGSRGKYRLAGDEGRVQDPAASRILAADSLRDAEVFDRAGEEIGHVKTFLVDTQSSRVAHVVIAHEEGGQYVIPWEAVNASPEGALKLNVASAKVAGGPRWEQQQAGELDPGWVDKVYVYYGLNAY